MAAAQQVLLDEGSISSGLPSSAFGAVVYQGTWNAATNSPAIATGSAAAANKGFYYKVTIAGTTTVDGISAWGIGDWIISDGVSWGKVDNAAATGAGGGAYPKGACWDGLGSALTTTSTKVVRCLPCQSAGTIVSTTAQGDFAGSCTVEVWKTTYSGAPATAADKISGSSPITLIAANKSQDLTLGGWSKTVAAGDIIAFKLTSVSALSWLTVGIQIA